MPKFFLNNNQIINEEAHITGEDVNHIKNVLRMKIGDELNICDVDNCKNYIAKIKALEEDRIVCEISKQIESISESNVKVHIFQGLPKADKMELIIQKSVELGAEKIIPVEMKRCVVKLDNKDKRKKQERWQKIAEVAAKQSGRDIIPEVSNVKNVKDISQEFSWYDVVLLCYENEKEKSLKSILKSIDLSTKSGENNELKIAVIIGPEGGVDISEVEYMQSSGAKVVSLGNRILRTETVALSCLSIIMYEFERNET